MKVSDGGYPAGHPLHNVPIDILMAARTVTVDAETWGGLSEEYAEPLADAVVMELLPWIYPCGNTIITDHQVGVLLQSFLLRVLEREMQAESNGVPETGTLQRMDDLFSSVAQEIRELTHK